MASNFARLYNQLNKQTYDSLPNDMTYDFERQELMYALGYDVAHKSGPKAVTRSTYHGKNVRKIRDERPISKWGTTADPHEAMEKRRIVQSTAKSGKELSKITREMAKSIQTDGTVPDTIVRKLMAHDDRATLSLIKASIVSPVKVYNKDSVYNTESPTLPPIDPKHLRRGEGIRQDFNSDNKRSLVNSPSKILKFTKQKWTTEERQHLNRLYLELPLPSNLRNRDLWQLYLQGFAARFVLVHPTRTPDEVMEKVQEMINKKQFKEKDEVERWEAVAVSRIKA